ncbi:MAG: Peptidoglycan endopeptidase LytF precursor [Firmicutes bacterium ADurb.Bin248]|nr:MAG: Peptidoglycan endopeptidase LytF precursor [Firmicutes bacterium ADurb.Bin248]HOG01051.1 peptidoglycan-binding protein [Clostridia bacterium]HPK15532.1 peptidoglycan-binding protein [Clostridia bacterium]
MGNRIRKTLKRMAKRAVLSIRKFHASWRRAGIRKRTLFVGSASGVVVMVAVLVVLLASSGKAEAGAPATARGETALFTGAQNASGADVDVVDITPPPTFRVTPTLTPTLTPTPTPDPILRRGMEDERVTRLQVRLIELGYLELDQPTMKFGPATEDAVRHFQRQVNFTKAFIDLGVTLAEDGQAGPSTLDLLYGDDAPKYCVVFGMKGDDITDMQEQLKDLGYMDVVTGNYLETTVAALKSFQEENGLSADGMCGEKTFNLLYSDDAKESPNMRKSARTRANIDKMISVAKDQLGDPYIRGNKGPSSFDCSGLVYYCLKQAGSNRRRLNAAGYSKVSDWEKISDIDDLKKGDLIFFYDDDFTKIGHVGIIINSSEMIDASSSNGEVVRREFKTSYWRKHFYCGRRPW